MKLADFKRIAVGTELRLVRTLMGPCDKPRIVRAVHSNSLEFTTEKGPAERASWLDFPKARDFRDDGDGFSILETDDRTGAQEIAAQYKFPKKASI